MEEYMNMTNFIIVGVLLLWIAYSKGWILANFPLITGAVALDMLKDKNSILIDVRTKDEYDAGNIKNSKLFPLQELSQSLDKLSKYKDKKLIIYCASGSRSVMASRILAKNGFSPFNVKGGIMALESY